MSTWTIAAAWVVALACAAARSDTADFPAVARKAPALPSLVAPTPLYGIFVFGKERSIYVWAVLDKTSTASPVYDVLYLDLNADGDVTQPGERFVGKQETTAPGSEARCTFEIGRYKEPGVHREHTDFSITWRTNRVSYRMKWCGGSPTMGGYGSEPDQYGNFSPSPATAPIFVPGQDRPLRFQHWMSGTLNRGQDNDFKVFIGNRGDGTGTFSAVDDKFLPAREYVVATLCYRDASGIPREARFDLKSRC